MTVPSIPHTRDNGRGEPRFLKPEELAELFRVPLETVYQWRRKRTGPPGFRVGRHLRYELDAVLEWVAQQSRAA